MPSKNSSLSQNKRSRKSDIRCLTASYVPRKGAAMWVQLTPDPGLDILRGRLHLHGEVQGLGGGLRVGLGGLMVAILSAGNQNIYFKLKVTIFYLFWHQFSLVLLSDQVDGDGGLLRGRGGTPLMVLALTDGLRADL